MYEYGMLFAAIVVAADIASLLVFSSSLHAMNMRKIGYKLNWSSATYEDRDIHIAVQIFLLIFKGGLFVACSWASLIYWLHAKIWYLFQMVERPDFVLQARWKLRTTVLEPDEVRRLVTAIVANDASYVKNSIYGSD